MSGSERISAAGGILGGQEDAASRQGDQIGEVGGAQTGMVAGTGVLGSA